MSEIGHKVLSAAFRGKLSKLTKLLEEEDPTLLDCPSVDYADENGTTPLHAACQEGQTECVALLLRAGAIADAPGAGGVTPLIVATESRQLACVKLLLGAKADPKAKDAENGATALHGACLRGEDACVSELLAHNASVDAADKAGATPLIVASYGGHAQCVDLLLKAGADDTLKYEGKTAIDLAEEAGHAECVKALEGRLATEQDVIKMRAREMFPKPSKEVEDEEEESAIVDDLPDEDLTPKERSKREAKQLQKQMADAMKASQEAAKKGTGGLLEEMAEGMKASGMRGAELFEEKKRELEAEERAIEKAEAAKKAAEEAREAAKPKSSADAKARGTELFSEGRMAEAADMYALGLELLEEEEEALLSSRVEEIKVDGSAENNKAANAKDPPQKAVLHCNLAACRLRQRLWKEAVESCDAACNIHPQYTKALYRRAQAKRALKEYDGAIADVEAAQVSLKRVWGGKNPTDPTGKRTMNEMLKFGEAVKEEVKEEEKAAERKWMEEYGITLGGAEGTEDEKSVYYHYASQGERTQDFMWWMRTALKETLKQQEYEIGLDSGRELSEWRPSNGYPIKQNAIIQVGDFDPIEGDDGSRGILEGTCTIRTAKGRRALFLDLTVEVPWRGWLDTGTDSERTLGGKTRLWNITHFNELHEWQHLNNRNTNEVGPWTDAIAEMLAPAMAAMLRVGIQEVLHTLMMNRIDPAHFLPPPKPKPTSRGWGKGTVDYSKWDALSDDEEDEERIVDVTEEEQRKQQQQSRFEEDLRRDMEQPKARFGHARK